jgi:hypothetical protein
MSQCKNFTNRVVPERKHLVYEGIIFETIESATEYLLSGSDISEPLKFDDNVGGLQEEFPPIADPALMKALVESLLLLGNPDCFRQYSSLFSGP